MLERTSESIIRALLLSVTKYVISRLALLVSERKVVVFPAQDEFLKSGPAAQQAFMKYFGKPNYQPVSGSIEGFPGFHIIHRDGNKAELDK